MLKLIANPGEIKFLRTPQSLLLSMVLDWGHRLPTEIIGFDAIGECSS